MTFGNLLNFNFGVVGIVISTGIVNLIICSVLSTQLKNYAISLPNLIILKKIIFLIISSIISSFIAYHLFFNAINTNSINTNYIIDFLQLSIGVMSYLCVYFVITKFLKINNLNFKFIK